MDTILRAGVRNVKLKTATDCGIDEIGTSTYNSSARENHENTRRHQLLIPQNTLTISRDGKPCEVEKKKTMNFLSKLHFDTK